jgi:hypothetical protein
MYTPNGNNGAFAIPTVFDAAALSFVDIFAWSSVVNQVARCDEIDYGKLQQKRTRKILDGRSKNCVALFGTDELSHPNYAELGRWKTCPHKHKCYGRMCYLLR